jgi:hypothetical protein
MCLHVHAFLEERPVSCKWIRIGIADLIWQYLADAMTDCADGKPHRRLDWIDIHLSGTGGSIDLHRPAAPDDGVGEETAARARGFQAADSVLQILAVGCPIAKAAEPWKLLRRGT